MALISCPECGKEVSDKARTCIHCGYPLPIVKKTEFMTNKTQSDVQPTFEIKTKSKKSKILLAIISIALVGIILICSRISKNIRIAEPRVHFTSNTEMSELLENGKWWQTYKGQNLGFYITFDGSTMTFIDTKGEFDTSYEQYTLDYKNSVILKNGKFRFDVIEINGDIYLRQNPETDEKSWVLFELY